MPSVSAPSTSSGYGVTWGYASPCSARRPTCGPFPWVTTSSWERASSARASTATVTLRRWASASAGSPRRSRALPPRATTMRIASPLPSGREGGQHRLLGRQPVRRLLPDRTARAVDDAGGDFLAAVGRQAVQEDGVVRGERHELGVDAVGREVGEPAAALLLVAHRHPDVGID